MEITIGIATAAVAVLDVTSDISNVTVKVLFDPENLSKIICEFMKLRLNNIDNIKVDDYTDCAIKTIQKTTKQYVSFLYLLAVTDKYKVFKIVFHIFVRFY